MQNKRGPHDIFLAYPPIGGGDRSPGLARIGTHRIATIM
jgi:hypothetical protein